MRDTIVSVQDHLNVPADAPKFHILGTGGIAVVLVEVMFDMGFRLAQVFDDNDSLRAFQGIDIQPAAPLYQLGKGVFEEPIFICIGNNVVRKKIAHSISAPYITAQHPSAHVAPTADIGAGSMIFHGAFVQASATLGRHVIVNTAASIDHDCQIGDFVHIAPQVALSGGVQIGEGSEVGVGACVLPNKKIGKWTKVGAGATVIDDIPDNAVAVGTPAKVIKINGERV